MARYRYVLFDADNTLFDFYRAERSALCDSLAGIGVRADTETVETYSRINDRMWKMLERGEISKIALRTKRFEEFCAHYGIQTDVGALAKSYTDHLATKVFLMEGAVETCRTLAAHCELYIITNGIQSVQTGRFSRSPLVPFFKDLFISEELGFEKPNPAYFDKVAQRIPGFSKKDALVVGDSLSSDIAGGVAAGIDTCWLNHAQQAAPEKLPITYTVSRLEEVIPLVLGA